MKRLSLLLISFCAFVVVINTFTATACSQEIIRRDVRLEVVDISEQKIRLKIANESKKPIFLLFQPSTNKQAKVSYSILCKSPKYDDNYFEYGGENNLDLPLTPLNRRDYLFFDIDNDFRMGSDKEMVCEAKVGYYENKRVVALIAQTASSEADSERVKKARNFASVKFVLK